jgi:MFS family permease
LKLSRAEWPLWAAIFLDLVGFASVLVDFQFRAERVGSPGWKIGMILASTFVVQALVSPYWGRVSDRLGRKPVFLFCTGLSAASMAAYALAPDSWWLLVSRLIAGLGAANTAIAQAAVADAFDEASRPAALGRLGAALNSGLILGPAAGGWVAASLGSQAVGWMGFAFSLAGLLVAWLFADMRPGGFEVTARKFSFGSLLRENPSVLPFFAASVAAWFSLAMLEGTFGRLIKRMFGAGSFEFGMIFAYESVIGVGVSAFLLGVLLVKGKERWMLSASYLMMGAGLALMPLVPQFWWIFAPSFLYAFGQGFASPAVNALCSREVADDRQGELFGLMQGARSIGFVLGPVLGGALFDWQASSPYFIAGAVCLASALIVLSARQSSPR